VSQDQSQSGTQPAGEPFQSLTVIDPQGNKGEVLMFQDKVIALMPGEEPLTVPNRTLHAIVNVLDAVGIITIRRPHAKKPTIDATALVGDPSGSQGVPHG